MKKLNILYEDKYLLVVYKKNNYLTVSDGTNSNSLYSEVYDYLHKKNCKVFVVHRLDKDTCGLVIFAKSEIVKQTLQNNWDNVIRKYYAVVHGETKNEDTIISNIYEDKNHFSHSGKVGKKAITKYKLLSSNTNYSLLEIQILTGRKNQIRVHMSDKCTPIVGDHKYGIKDTHRNMFLCAYYLKFNHPVNNNEIEIKYDIPKEYINIVK